MDKRISKVLIISTCVIFVISLFIYLNEHRELTVKYAEATAFAEKGEYENLKEEVAKYITGDIVKVIYVPKKILNIIVK